MDGSDARSFLDRLAGDWVDIEDHICSDDDPLRRRRLRPLRLTLYHLPYIVFRVRVPNTPKPNPEILQSLDPFLLMPSRILDRTSLTHESHPAHFHSTALHPWSDFLFLPNFFRQSS